VVVYKPKQHSKQYTCFKYVIYIEMTDKNFGPISQCHKKIILHIIFKKNAIWPGIIKQPVNAGSQNR